MVSDNVFKLTRMARWVDYVVDESLPVLDREDMVKFEYKGFLKNYEIFGRILEADIRGFKLRYSGNGRLAQRFFKFKNTSNLKRFVDLLD